MASIGCDENGLKRILFVAGDGKRKTIRLGKKSMKQAESIKVKVEDLVGATKGGRVLHEETEKWLRDLDQDTYDRLVGVQLVRPREQAGNMTLAGFLDKLFATFGHLKENTLKNYGQTRRVLEEYFGKARPIRSITAMEADEWRAWLTTTKEKKVATATASKWTINARHFFKFAVKWEAAGENPFAEVHCGLQTNRSRMFEVTRDMATKVIEACPDAEWKLMFALARYGGLRCPSEHLALKWDDVDFVNNRMLVYSPKTEHHEGKESRMVPIFPELLPHLWAAHDAAEDGAVYVIGRYRDTRKNLRTQLCRLIRRAGLVPWPKPWVNLRSSRETELVETYPIQVVTAWLGNSPKVAQNHYLQVQDAHFAKAIGTAKTEAAQAAHIPAQCTAK